MAEAILPDSSVIRVPDFALEATQTQMLAVLKLLVKENNENQKLYEELIKETKYKVDQQRAVKYQHDCVAKQDKNIRLNLISPKISPIRHTEEDRPMNQNASQSFQLSSFLQHGS